MSATEDTLAALKSATSDLAKSITQGTGLVNYDLQAPAKLIYPLITPLRNSIPRVKGDGGTATNWRVITALNGGNALGLVGEGNRGGVMSTTATTKSASYKTIGLDDYVTFEADLAAQGFDDVKALAVRRLLQAVMQEEERQILWGNNSVAFGTTATPALTAGTSGGSLVDGTYSVICVALTGEAWKAASVGASGVPVAATRTNADGSTDTINGGASQKSSNQTITLSGGTSAQTVKATVTAKDGAAGYAWYFGAAASEKIVALTTINSVVITASPDSGNQAASALPSADKSQESLAFDGLVSQIITSGSGAYVKALATGTAGTGTVLTSNGNAGINEIDDLLADRWYNYKIDPDEVWVSGKQFMKMNALIMANGSAPFVRLQMDGAKVTGDMITNRRVGFYQNPITGKVLEIKVHPDMPDSWILVRSTSIPYAISNVVNPLEVKCRRDYYQIEYPLRSRKYEYGVYADEVLACYFPPAFGLITNVATGKADGT